MLWSFASLALAACGKQVTPNPPNSGPQGLAPGYASVKFDVAGPFNFSTYRYFFVFNTSGSGITPLTNAQQTNWAGYSFAIEVGGGPGSTFAGAYQYVRTPNCGTHCAAPSYVGIGTTPAQFQYYPDSNGSGTEFEVIFAPVIAKGIATTGQATPPPVASTWLFNAFTTQPNVNAQLTFVDSLGVGGPVDTTYSSPQFNMKTQFDQVIYGLYSNTGIDPAADIVSVEFANNPATPSPSPKP